MDSQTLSQLLDRAIAELLAQSVAQKNVRVVVTGDDLSSLPETLNCLAALEQAGYALWVSFSHSASQSALTVSEIGFVSDYPGLWSGSVAIA